MSHRCHDRLAASVRGGPVRPLPCLVGAVLALLLAAGCKPTERVKQDLVLSVQDVRLTAAAPQFVVPLSLTDDPFFAEHADDLDQIEGMRLEIGVSANSSSRLRLGVYVSRERETRLIETTKIADFNLLPGDLAPPGTAVRVINETQLRGLILSDSFHLYVVAEADRIDVTISRLDLIVTANFIE